MSHGMISGIETRFNFSTKTNLLSRKSVPETTPRLFLKTHHVKPRISIKTQSGSCRGRTKAAINNLYGTSQQTTESFYELLGVSVSGTIKEIKQAYKQLALKYHPDVSPPDRIEEYTKRFIQLRQAYETLSDPKTRALYDHYLATGFNLSFSQGRSHFDQRIDEWGLCRECWVSQLMELKQRSQNKDSRRHMSGRIRRERSQTFDHSVN